VSDEGLEKNEFYSYIMKLWFEGHPVNARNFDIDKIRETFMKGGYYRVDITEKLSVIGMNSVAFSFKNDRDNQG
jgi:hypothetical protein